MFSRRLLMLFMFGWLFLAFLSVYEGEGQETPPLRFGYSIGMFRDIGTHDAQAATRVWIDTLMKQKKMNRPPAVSIFTEGIDREKALAQGQVDILILLSTEYLSSPHRSSLAPCFVGVRRGGVGEQYLLLVRKDTGFGNLAQLQGKRLVVDQGTICVNLRRNGL